MRDNSTVAGEQEIVQDHDLIKRTHSKGILLRDTWWDGQGMCAMYSYAGAVSGERRGNADTTMNMILRPGEAIEWRWGHGTPLKHHGALYSMPAYPELICNGLWEYRPDFSREEWRRGAAAVENISSGPDGLAAADGQRGSIIWNMKSPYVFVGGRIVAKGAGARFFISVDGKTWQSVKDKLDKSFSVVGPARYEYRLKCQLEGPARLRSLTISNDVQMAPLSLPEMVVGDNAFTYTDESSGDRRVRITHHWVERSASRPPLAPASAVYPADGGKAQGTDLAFQWTPATDPDGDAIGDYQFELSSRPDMRFPLSMCFYKLISRTADVDKENRPEARYTLLQPGLLTPDRQYYWHVRAMDSKGVWGPWSQTWHFTPRPRVSAGSDHRPRSGRGYGRPPLEAEYHWPPSGQVPRLWQRREGIHDCRPAVPGYRGSDEIRDGVVESLVPREFHRRDLSHRPEGDRLRRHLGRGQQDLLSRRSGGRARQAQRTFGLRDRPPPGDL